MRPTSGDCIQYEECFPVGDYTARSTDMIGWGPHNVLHVAMRWSVKFFVGGLLSPSREVALQQHSLTHRSDEASEEVVIGAKWALGLLPEGRYPAEARIAVATNANLLVYRVARQGNGKTRVSKGLGVGLCFSTADIAKKEHSPRIDAHESTRLEESSCKDGADVISLSEEAPLKARGVEADAPAGQDLLSRKSVQASLASTTQGLSVKLDESPAQQSEDALSDEHTDEDEENTSTKRKSKKSKSSRKNAKGSTKDSSSMKKKSEGGSPTPHSRKRKISSGESKQELSSHTRYQHPLVDYFWMPKDVLLVITTDGVYLVNFFENFDDEMIPQLLALPSPLYNFQEDILGTEMAFPSAAAMVKCSFEMTSSMRECPIFSSVSDRVLIVASAFVLRILHVAEDKVQLVHYVEVPSLTALPSCVCAFWSPTSSATPGEYFHHHRPSVEALQGIGRDSSAQVRIIIGTPIGVEYGYFPLNLAVFQSQKECDHVADVGGAPWMSLSIDTPEGFIEHLFLRAISLISLEDLRPSLASSSSDSTASIVFPRGSPWAILGLSRQCLLAMLLGTGENKITMVPLFRCGSLAGATEASAEAAIAVCGVALHPSHTLAILAVQMGIPRYDAAQLYPVSVDVQGGFLRRLLELHDALAAPFTGEGAWNRSNPDPSGLSPRPPRTAFATGNGEGLAVVLSKQRRALYFLWEKLFPQSHDHLSMRSYRESWRRFYAESTSGAPASLSQPSSAIRKLEGGGGFPLHPSETVGIVEEVVRRWRQQYLQLRKQYGVELFLRYLPPTGEEEDRYLGDVDMNGERATLGKYWWAILRILWRLRPLDATPLYEIILANAIRVIGMRFGYGALQLSSEEAFWQVETHPGASVSAYELNCTGAVAFAHLYLQKLKEGLKKETTEGGAFAPWCCSAIWAESIQSFLSKLGIGEADEALFSQMYPCSVCDAACAACFSWNFMFDSKHVAHDGGETSSHIPTGGPEVHTSVFSPRTFSPLSLFSESGVLTKCFGCGFCDFAVGPFCRICGGLLK
ncbi:unnamed protein product [Phytomonas sp. EM1]|nr:unnamed protein product [Phytomonas sp. EM1]|eukprot:CCW63338.1 unnamed protein product [Phytomonas sp. isolate EM1]